MQSASYGLHDLINGVDFIGDQLRLFNLILHLRKTLLEWLILYMAGDVMLPNI